MRNFILAGHSSAKVSFFECCIRAIQAHLGILWSARAVSALARCGTGIFLSHPFVQRGTDQLSDVDRLFLSLFVYLKQDLAQIMLSSGKLL